MTLPENITPGVTTGHVAHHVELHRRFNLGDTWVNAKADDYGALGDGATNDTAAIAAAYAATPAGGVLYFPEGVYITDPLVITKAITLMGSGRFASWLRPRTAIAGPFVHFNLSNTPPPSGIRNYYGSSVQSLGLDCYTAPACTGILVGTGSTWALLRDVLVNGCTIGIDMRGINSWIEDVFCGDNIRHIVVDNDTGGQLTIRDGYLARNVLGITTVAVDITNTAAASGASIRIYNVQVASSTDVDRHTAAGIRISAPTNQSAPVFATMNEIDNIYGGAAFESVNCQDINLTSNWMNSTGPCVQITGGQRIKLIGNEMFGSPSIKFLGGATQWVTSRGNTMYSSPHYWLPATGKPVVMDVDDHLIGAVADSHITNDMPGLLIALNNKIGPLVVAQKLNRRAGGVDPPTGNGKLVAGVKVINNTKVTANTRVRVDLWSPSGTIGHLWSSPNDNVPGVSFTVLSSSATDTSDFYWEMWEAV